ncbi:MULTISPECIES: HAMP domain-containing sensor histidine kinase [Pandoraea]|uniref:sensor histidine kinase n=1 Tax=Pandoraea TaxID=93217 RepID=UPI001F5CF928|nr:MULTISPECIES: HAMP domain-containing sensor histidine kinase [Pandoraea]MCI3206673.1 two-component sensor histidine kinase [Pandoraea sp. LA3]MDN4584701.1 two-component sensor histidine kinase [Pandoraea capi]
MLKSLRNQLVIAIGVVVSLFAVIQGVSSYHFSVTGTSALLDRRMEWLATRVRVDFSDGSLSFHLLTRPDTHDLVIAVWQNGEDAPAFASDPTITLPRDATLGFTTREINGEKWRLYTRRRPDQLVQIAQRISVRDSIEKRAATRTLWPIVLFIPLVWVAVLLVVSRSLRRLNQLGARARAVDVNHLQPLPLTGVPNELLPFVRSINMMIERLAHSIETERQFIADAAHELRTPLTALQLQADNLQGEIAPGSLERFRELQGGISRSSNLITQLLRLARADAPPVGKSMTRAMTSVDVGAAVVTAVADVLPTAIQRGIDIGADEMDDARVQAVALDVDTVVRNLVCNAVRYTPNGGRVDISTRVRGLSVDIVVMDSGPGIDESVLPRVFDRFFRVNADGEGSGLGLAIVKAIVMRYEGTVTLRNRRDGQSGIVATVSLPVERTAGA